MDRREMTRPEPACTAPTCDEVVPALERTPRRIELLWTVQVIARSMSSCERVKFAN